MKPRIDALAEKAVFKTATFALGCFWGPEARFGGNSAILRTRVGYAGGTTADPTYQHISDYIEAVQIDYDPNKISFAELLHIFWQSHDPTHAPYKRQYQSAIFYHDEEQHNKATTSKATVQAKTHQPLTTEILSATPFYLAENYHQKYRLQNMPELIGEFKKIYPSFSDFMNSTAVARCNGILAGYGSISQLEAEIGDYGLSTKGQAWLMDFAKTVFD